MGTYRLVLCLCSRRVCLELGWGPPLATPEYEEWHRWGRRCSHSKALIQGVRCDPRHWGRHGTRPARGGLSYGTYYYPRLGDWFTGPDNDRRWDLGSHRSVQARGAGSA